MKNKFYNSVNISGVIYDSSKLVKKVSGPNSKNPGTEFIMGDLKIATDKDMINVVDVHFSYITPVYGKSGKPNPNFNVLKDIVDGKIGSIMGASKEEAAYISIDGTMTLNDFFVEDKEADGGYRAVAAKRIEGSFVKVITKGEHESNQLAKEDSERSENDFDFDFLIRGCFRKEANEERGLPEKVILKGNIFDDFRKTILPIELSVVDEGAMNYFESLEVSDKNQAFTRVRGRVVSEIISRKIEEKSAFGKPTVKIVNDSHKDYVINWAQPDLYDLGDESILTGEEFAKMVENRNIYLADVKAKQEEYQNNKNTASAASAFTTTSSKGKVYNF